VADETLEALLARLAEEQQQADRLYNDALTALDRALPAAPAAPHPPPPYDPAGLDVAAALADILAGAPVAPADRSLKGRLKTMVWRLVGPPLSAQRSFNRAIVDHLSRNVASHVEAAKASATTIALLGQQIDALATLHNRLILYLQTITLYVDTKDRAVAGQAQVLNAGLSAIADDWLKRWESLSVREARYASRHESLAAAYGEARDLAALAQQSAMTLKREVERLIARGAAPASSGGATVDLESFKYEGFEDRFRGSRERIRAQLADYVPRFAGQTDVLDLGCGRGEFLELLRGAGIGARGVDLNHEMVEVCRAKGLDVVETDALGGLESAADGSLGGIFAAQVVEHLDPSYLMRLIDVAALKLRPGGVIVLETINPACWAAFFDSYIRDLTHVRPIHPETLQYLLRASGLRDVQIAYRAPVDPMAKLTAAAPATETSHPEMASLLDAFNANVEKLNARMFTYQDYAAIGRK
jgi:O-antigen chain-terminating methyltransferase